MILRTSKTELTPLQRQMYSIKTIRQAIRDGFSMGTPPGLLRGFTKEWDDILKEAIIADLTDNQCRDFLYLALYDPATPQKDRQKIEKILHLR